MYKLSTETWREKLTMFSSFPKNISSPNQTNPINMLDMPGKQKTLEWLVLKTKTDFIFTWKEENISADTH